MYSNAADQHMSRRVVLPFYDPNTGEEGVQFGMPPTQGGQKHGFEYSIIILSGRKDDVRCRRVDYPKLENPPGEPPTPVWLWSNVAGEWRRVGAPARNDESIPVHELQGDVIGWAPENSMEAGDVFRRPIETGAGQTGVSGEIPVSACGHRLATATTDVGYVQEIKPTQLAEDMRLWTSHLIQLTHVRVSQRANA